MAVVLATGIAAPAAAQTIASSGPEDATRWDVIDAVGYGGLGFGLGLMAAWDMESDGFGPPGRAVALIGVTSVAGIVGGAVLGWRARGALSRGRRLGGVHRAAVAGGAILAGGTLGALAAIPLINGEGQGTPLGTDEQTVTLMILGGSALGGLFAWTRRGELGSRSVRVAPAISRGGGYALSVRVSF